MSLTLSTSPTLTFQVTTSASVRPSPTSGSLYSATGVPSRVGVRPTLSRPALRGQRSVGQRAVHRVEHTVEVGKPLLLDAARRGGGSGTPPRQHPGPGAAGAVL